MAMTMLNAVNICLRGVGESPSFSIDSTNPYVIAAVDIITDKNKDIQSKGWYFNSQKGFTIHPDTEGQLFVPQNILSINTHRGVQVAIRGNRLFDLANSTYIFDGDLDVDIVYEVDFEEVPYAAAKLIACASAEEMQSTYEGDKVKLVRLYDQTKMARIELKKLHLRNSNFNVMDRAVSPRRISRRNPNFIGG